MCHNLWDGSRGPPATVFTIPGLLQFVYLYFGSLIYTSTGSTCDISRRSAITRAAMQSLEKQDLEVTARHLNEVEAVQHVHLTNIPVWFGLLGDI